MNSLPGNQGQRQWLPSMLELVCTIRGFATSQCIQGGKNSNMDVVVQLCKDSLMEL